MLLLCLVAADQTEFQKIFPKIVSAAELLAKTIRKSMTFHPPFSNFSTLKGYFTGFIGGTGILFMYNFPQGARLSVWPEKVSRIFFRCIVISKNKLEIIELFAIFYQIVKIETLCLRKY